MPKMQGAFLSSAPVTSRLRHMRATLSFGRLLAPVKPTVESHSSLTTRAPFSDPLPYPFAAQAC